MTAPFSPCHIHVYEEEISFSHAPMDIVRSLVHELSVREGLPADEVMEHIRQRELDEPTAIGRELAIPHARMQGMPHACMMIAKCSEPVLWGNKFVRLFVVTIVPENRPEIYLQTMSRLIRWRMSWDADASKSWDYFTLPLLYDLFLSELFEN